MSRLRSFSLPLIAISTLVMAVMLTSCSKKDVVSDEPAMTPSDSGTLSGSGTGSSGSAGDVGIPSSDLQTAYFAYDSYSLTGETRSALKANATWLKQNPNARIQVEGHCDERGTTEYNMALGDRRANAVKTYLAKLGVDRGRMDTISFGEDRPADPGHDETGWAKNRRAVFIVLSN